MNPTKQHYLEQLDKLSARFEEIPNTPMGMYLKVSHLICLNMRYELVEFNPKLTEHPYIIAGRLIAEQLQAFNGAAETLFIEGDPHADTRSFTDIEKKHHDPIWAWEL